jgi:hypothetical protein
MIFANLILRFTQCWWVTSALTQLNGINRQIKTLYHI